MTDEIENLSEDDGKLPPHCYCDGDSESLRPMREMLARELRKAIEPPTAHT